MGNITDSDFEYINETIEEYFSEVQDEYQEQETIFSNLDDYDTRYDVIFNVEENTYKVRSVMEDPGKRYQDRSAKVRLLRENRTDSGGRKWRRLGSYDFTTDRKLAREDSKNQDMSEKITSLLDDEFRLN